MAKTLSTGVRTQRVQVWAGELGVMTEVVVPVRYPLGENSRATLAEAVRIAREEAAELTVLHVDLYQEGKRVTRDQLARAVEDQVDDLPDVRYVVRRGLLVEDAILDEAAAIDADVVVIGAAAVGRWRRLIRRLGGDPDIARYLSEELDCRLVTVDA